MTCNTTHYACDCQLERIARLEALVRRMLSEPRHQKIVIGKSCSAQPCDCDTCAEARKEIEG